MAAGLWPILGIIAGGVFTVIAARLNSRPAEQNASTSARTADLSELRAMLEEQRTMLDRSRDQADRDRDRIEALEAEVADCEAGRAADRDQAAAALAELRHEVRTLGGTT